MDSIEDCPPGSLPDAGSAADPPDPDRTRYLEMLRAVLDAALRGVSCATGCGLVTTI